MKDQEPPDGVGHLDPDKLLKSGVFEADPSAKQDRRAVSILTDRERVEFLAVADWNQLVSWNVVYLRLKKQLNWCLKVAEQREAEGKLKAARRAKQKAQDWEVDIEHWETLLLLSGSQGGRRVKQLVESITAGATSQEGEGAFTRLAVMDPRKGDDDEPKKRGLFRRR